MDENEDLALNKSIKKAEDVFIVIGNTVAPTFHAISSACLLFVQTFELRTLKFGLYNPLKIMSSSSLPPPPLGNVCPLSYKLP